VYLPAEYNVLVLYLLTKVIQHTQNKIRYNLMQVQYVYCNGCTVATTQHYYHNHTSFWYLLFLLLKKLIVILFSLCIITHWSDSQISLVKVHTFLQHFANLIKVVIFYFNPSLTLISSIGPHIFVGYQTSLFSLPKIPDQEIDFACFSRSPLSYFSCLSVLLSLLHYLLFAFRLVEISFSIYVFHSFILLIKKYTLWFVH
jgi:hypothetical protein